MVADMGSAFDQNVRTVFAFEGKKRGENFDVTKSQLLGYVKLLDRPKFGMFGIGKKCAFFRFDGQNLANIKATIDRGGNLKVGDNQNKHGIHYYEFGTQGDDRCIDGILESIVDELAT